MTPRAGTRKQADSETSMQMHDQLPRLRGQDQEGCKAAQRRRERLAQGSHRQSTQAVGSRAGGCARFGARGAAVVRVRGSGGPGEEEGVWVGVGVVCEGCGSCVVLKPQVAAFVAVAMT
jgi:hypothetical protein